MTENGARLDERTWKQRYVEGAIRAWKMDNPTRLLTRKRWSPATASFRRCSNFNLGT